MTKNVFDTSFLLENLFINNKNVLVSPFIEIVNKNIVTHEKKALEIYCAPLGSFLSLIS